MPNRDLRSHLSIKTLAVISLSIHLHCLICIEYMLLRFEIGSTQIVLLVHVEVEGSGILGYVLIGLRLGDLHEGLINVPVCMADSSFFEETRIIYMEVMSVSEGIVGTTDTKTNI